MQRRKIYYVPGLISLIGLPLFFILFIPAVKPEMAIKLFLPYDRWCSDERYLLVFSKERFIRDIISKKIVEIDLGSNNIEENSKLGNDRKTLIYNEFTKFKASGDTNTVLKVRISKLNTYGEFVWLVNQTLVHKINRWMFEDGDFYFLNTIPDGIMPETEVTMFNL
jgi:hypothetical protein